MNKSKLFAAAAGIATIALFAPGIAQADQSANAIGCGLKSNGVTAVAYLSQDIGNEFKKGDAIFRYRSHEFVASSDGKITPLHVYDRKNSLSEAQIKQYEQRVRDYIAALGCITSASRNDRAGNNSVVKAAFDQKL